MKMDVKIALLQLFIAVIVDRVSSESSVDKGMSCKEKAKGIADLNLIGSFVPKCEPDGTYSPLQCHASTGICWCADKFGDVVPQNLIRGTKCDNPCFKKILENPAPSILIQGAVNPISIGAPVPDCDADGFYKPKQCADDKCWCVNQHGSEIQETKGNHYAVSC